MNYLEMHSEIDIIRRGARSEEELKTTFVRLYGANPLSGRELAEKLQIPIETELIGGKEIPTEKAATRLLNACLNVDRLSVFQAMSPAEQTFIAATAALTFQSFV